MRYIDGPWSLKRVATFIHDEQRSLSEDGFCRWALWAAETNQLIGFCGFVRDGEQLEIGWRLDPQYWQQGIGHETARHVIDWAFRLKNANIIFAKMHVLNIASQKLAESVGMRRVGRVPVAEFDDFRYEITAECWQQSNT